MTHMEMRDRLHQATMRLTWALDRLGKNDDDAAMHLELAETEVRQVLDGLASYPVRKP